MPDRIRRSRAKGWRLPEGAVIVDRTTPWSNPFVVAEHGTAQACVDLYRFVIGQPGMLCIAGKGIDAAQIERQKSARAHLVKHLAELRGKDLCCRCRLDRPCHADVLLELANA